MYQSMIKIYLNLESIDAAKSSVVRLWYQVAVGVSGGSYHGCEPSGRSQLGGCMALFLERCDVCLVAKKVITISQIILTVVVEVRLMFPEWGGRKRETFHSPSPNRKAVCLTLGFYITRPIKILQPWVLVGPKTPVPYF